MNANTRDAIEQIIFNVQFHQGPYAEITGSYEIRAQAARDIETLLEG